MTDEDVAISKLEDIMKDRGHRVQVRCVPADNARYAFEARIGNKRSKPRSVPKSLFDSTSSSGDLPKEVDMMASWLCRDLSKIPDDPGDRQLFPKFDDGVSGEQLGALLRSFVTSSSNGLTAAEVVTKVLGSLCRSDSPALKERVRNILDHLTCASELGIRFKDERYRAAGGPL